MVGGKGSGLLNDVWRSDDGINWTLVKESASFQDREDHELAIYNDALYIIGGSGNYGILNDIYKSTDGRVWVKVNPATALPQREIFCAAEFNNSLII